jgi:glucuronate isomerase
MSFINKGFLLRSAPAQRLYHDYAIDCLIHDYHSHLDPARIRDNTPFENLTNIWLEGDHYKWRAMRTAGVDESLITEDASDEDKFLAWATVVPKTLGNPLYHWTHMELLTPFGIDELLGPDNALDIFIHCTQMLKQPELHPQGLLRHWNVKTACTTDDPVDDVSVHQNASTDFTSVRPTFRPDNAFGFNGSGSFNRWLI